MKQKSSAIARIAVSFVIIVFMALLSVRPATIQAAGIFPDVPTSSNYYKPVIWASENGIVNGFSNGYFGPEESCTREQFVVMIWRLNNKPESDATANFSDVNSSRSTYKAMQWAVGRGIIKGFSDGSFRPSDTVTRQQVAIMLWRMAGQPAADRNITFTDFNSDSVGYKAVQWGVEAGLIKGFSDGSFGPDQNCLRQQIVIFLYRYAREVMEESIETEVSPEPEGGSEIPDDPDEDYSEDGTKPQEPESTGDIEDEHIIYAKNGSRYIEIKLENNSSADAFLELLNEGDVTVEMHDYGSFEKVGPLGTTLPRNDEQITTEPGDVILYQGDQITIYYDVNTWSFTRLGKAQGMTQSELKEFLGEGDVTIVFSCRQVSS